MQYTHYFLIFIFNLNVALYCVLFFHRFVFEDSQDQKKKKKKTIEGEQPEETTLSVVVSAALFNEYINIYDEALTLDMTTDEDILRESQKEHINEIES